MVRQCRGRLAGRSSWRAARSAPAPSSVSTPMSSHSSRAFWSMFSLTWSLRSGSACLPGPAACARAKPAAPAAQHACASQALAARHARRGAAPDAAEDAPPLGPVAHGGRERLLDGGALGGRHALGARAKLRQPRPHLRQLRNQPVCLRARCASARAGRAQRALAHKAAVCALRLSAGAGVPPNAAVPAAGGCACGRVERTWVVSSPVRASSCSMVRLQVTPCSSALASDRPSGLAAGRWQEAAQRKLRCVSRAHPFASCSPRRSPP